METTHVIRPHLYFRENADEAVSVEEAVRMMKNHEVALVGSLEDVFAVLAELGWKRERAEIVVNYGMYGAERLD